MVLLHIFCYFLHHQFYFSKYRIINHLDTIKLYFFTLTIYAVGAFTPPSPKKSKKVDIFHDFSDFSLMVSVTILRFFVLLVIIIKCEKNVLKKNTKKTGFSFSTLYFIFRKWTKINVQNCF